MKRFKEASSAHALDSRLRGNDTPAILEILREKVSMEFVVLSEAGPC